MSRIKFKRDSQIDFLETIHKISDLNWSNLAKKLGVHKRTLFDWRKGKYTLPQKILTKCLKLIEGKSQVDIPEYEVLPDSWSAKKAGEKGGKAFVQKYGNPGTPKGRQKGGIISQRKRKLHPELYQNCNLRKNIFYPRKSVRLAELTGILMGDGGMTDYQVTVTLNKETDKEYVRYIVDLFRDLFRIDSSVRERKKEKTCHVVASSRNLVEYLVKLGLKIGDKIEQGLDMPGWILTKKEYKVACLRGLMDTDGCIFTHEYRVNGKLYKYKKLSFTSYSQPLRQSVFKILSDNGLSPRLAGNRDVRIDSIADVKKYFEIFNSHNSKHLERYRD